MRRLRQTRMKILLFLLLLALIPISYRSYTSYRLAGDSRSALEEIAKHSCCGEHPRESIVKLNAILKRDPGCLEARYMLAEAYETAGDPAGAEREYKLAVRYAPRNAEGRYELGEFLWMRKRYGPAAAAFRKCIALDSEHQSAKAYLARCYEKLGETDAALKTWTEVLARKPNDEIAQRAVQRIKRDFRR